MDVVEVGVAGVARVSADAAGWQCFHADDFAIRNETTQRLQADEAFEHQRDALGVRLAHPLHAQVRPARLAHAACVIPRCAAVFW